MTATGRLILYVGPMFAGKSSHLIAAARGCRDVLALKPGFDTRDGAELVSRDGSHLAARSVWSWPAEADLAQHIVLDEAQFMIAPHYDGDIVAQLLEARARGADITVGGLDTDYRQQPFHVTARLMARADEVITLSARCHVCGQPARWTAKIHETGRLLETGDGELYEARCDAHWSLPEGS
ncbi:thymidine kinase [Gluconobacter morbifer]|uniref:Thymidine kinase n=1 Tax=Gluconobacter morbifer G707 TaxID=1088869 RepID=G6XKR7_9PROT|nr:thymidine kinase [Gluconobacter morbifer]EHH67630.1 thymidine kinase [Gluconobacter morbifer G707]